MKKPTYAYSHNGNFPFRFLAKRKNSEIIKNPYAPSRLNSLLNLNKGFKSLGISEATRKKIAFACRTLSYCSTPQTVRNGKGEYVTHVLQFVTLTLPSAQVHSDSDVTKMVLGSFLDRCRKIGLLRNYVWRAEKQKNGNIHYHLLTDTFCSFSMLKNMWYISLRKNGYMQAYSDKFKQMSFAEYSAEPYNKRATPSVVSARYARGVRNGWSEPPAIDVKQVTSPESVNAYISKYISKDSSGSDINVDGRNWGQSDSVRDAGKAWKSDKDFAKFWFDAGISILRKEVVLHDYFSMVKCSLSSILAWFPDVRKYVTKLVRTFFTPCEYWRNSMGLNFQT